MNDRLRWRWLFVAFTTISVGIASYYFFAAPRTLRIVVGPENSAQLRYVRAIAEAFTDTRQPFRLNVMVSLGSADSGATLDAKRADLGVLRSDDLASNEAQSVVILQRQAVIVLIRNESELKSLANLRGRSLSVVASVAAPNKPLIERLLSHYGIGANDVVLEEMSALDATKSLTEGRVDALILVASPASQRARRLIGELTEDSRLQTALTGLAGSNALAARFREVQTIEILAGIFGGTPLRPPKDLNSVAITLELVARSSLSTEVVSKLARSLMDIRSRVQKFGDGEYVIETPPLDEVRRFLPHSGTAAYLNDESKTLLETYSDHIWLALLGFSFLGTSLTAFLGWIGIKKQPKSVSLFHALPSVLDRLKKASTLVELDEVQTTIDAVIASFVRDVASGAYDPNSDVDPGPLLHLLPGLVERRRAELDGMRTRQRERGYKG